METWQIGKQIRKYRQEHGLSIRQFAEKSGVSSALVSQIENNQANPSLSILNAISKSIETPLYMLFAEDISNASCIMRRENRKTRFYDNSHHILMDVLTPSLIETKSDLFLMYLKAGAETANGFVEHDVEEIAYVLNGDIELVFENESFVLHEGDTVRILPKRKHLFRNHTKTVTKVLFVKSKQ